MSTIVALKMFCFSVAVVLVLQPLHVRSVHNEAYEAKSLVDSLAFKLHHQLKELKNTYQQTKQQISQTKQELVTVKKVQDLLSQLNNQQALNNACQHQYFVPDYFYKQNILIESKSALPVHYTISIQVNHKALIDEKKASANGKDLRVFFHENTEDLPVEIDRLVTGLGTNNASLQFRLQKAIPGNTVDGNTYAIVFGGKTEGEPKANPEKVFVFYEDFSDPTLRRWKQVWGDWSVKNGSVFGKTGASPYGDGEVGLYVKEGREWGDYAVELDLMETGSGIVYPGPFMRMQNPSLQQTTAWFFEYYTDQKGCTMRPYMNNNDGGWRYKCQLPENLTKNKWFHFKYRLLGNEISQWANGVSIQSATVASDWMIRRGTIALGCHRTYSGSLYGCRTFYDNIKVRLVVASDPTVSAGDTCRLTHHSDLLVGGKKLPADSCKQIHDASHFGQQKPRAKNGVYWIKTSRKNNEGRPTFCDMENGGWTLIGKIGGKVGNIQDSWLVQNVNIHLLKSPAISSAKGYACLDSRLLTVEHTSDIMFSSGDNSKGLGSKWVRWQLPDNVEYKTWWNHEVGYARVQTAEKTPVIVTAWDGTTKVCYQNKYGIMPLQQHGGSYPYTSMNKQGNTVTKDNCMAVGVLLTGSTANGWSQNGNGYDSAKSDSDWPNLLYNHQSPNLLVWFK